MIEYSSTDVGAPQIPLTGYSGLLLPILKACLVTGYGSKPGAGWTNPYNTGTTIAVFKQGADSNNRFFRVYNGFTTANAYGMAQVCIRGYENMTAISTGTGPFPTTAQVASNGLYYPFRQDALTQPVAWKIWADAKTVIVSIRPADGDVSTTVLTFGAFDSFKPGDTYNDMVAAYAGEYVLGYSYTFGSFGSLYVTRSHTGTGTSIPAANIATITYNVGSGPAVGMGGVPFPDPVSGKLNLYKINIVTSPSASTNTSDCFCRGVFRWTWDTLHSHATYFPVPTTFSGSGVNAGKTFTSIGGYNGLGAVLVETSNTWS